MNNKAVKAGITYLIGTFLVKSFSLISMPIFSRLLTTEDFGKVNNYISWAAIFSCVIGLGLSYSVGNAWMDYRTKIKEYIISIVFLVFICSIIFAILIVLLKDKVIDMFGLPLGIIAFMSIYNFFLQIENFVMMELRFELHSRMILAISIAECMLGFFVSLGLIYLDIFPVYVSRIIGLSVPAIIIGGGLFIYIWTSISCKHIATDFWKYSLKISVPMIPHGLAMIVLAQVDRVMINNLCGSHDVGIYSMGYTYGTVISILINAMGSAFLPWQYECMAHKEYKALKEAQNKITFLVMIVSIIIIAVTPEAIYILGGLKYDESIVVVFPVLIGTFFQYLYTFYCNVENYFKKNIYIAVASVITGMLNVILNYIFISQYGYIAAAYTTVACYIILYLTHKVLSVRVTGFELFSTYKNICAVGVVILFGILINVLSMRLIFRWSIMVIAIILYLIVEKNTIINIVGKIKSHR